MELTEEEGRFSSASLSCVASLFVYNRRKIECQ